MYSFLAAVKPDTAYDWFTYNGKEPVVIQFRGVDVEVKKGARFGVRPSANKKNIRLVFPDQITRVFTITLNQAKALAKGIKKER